LPIGEVFVLDDGGEVDLDLGNYERFLDVTLRSDNNITTGKIYQDVISRERRGDYLGKTVQGLHLSNKNNHNTHTCYMVFLHIYNYMLTNILVLKAYFVSL